MKNRRIITGMVTSLTMQVGKKIVFIIMKVDGMTLNVKAHVHMHFVNTQEVKKIHKTNANTLSMIALK